MPIPTTTELEEGKEDLDDLEALVNGFSSVATRLGGTKQSYSQLMSSVTHGTITTYSPSATYTTIDQWVSHVDTSVSPNTTIVYRPIPDQLPISPTSPLTTTPDPMKWVVASGDKFGDVKHYVANNYADLRSWLHLVPDGSIINVLDPPGPHFEAKTNSESPNPISDNGGTFIVSTDDSNRYAQRQYKGGIYVGWFEAALDGVSDDTTAWNSALALAGTERKAVTFDANSLCSSALNSVPQYASIKGLGNPTLTVTGGSVTPSGDNEFKDFTLDFNSTAGQLGGSTVSNILIEGLEVKNSTNNGIIFNTNSSKITIRKTKSHSHTDRGIYCNNCTEIFFYENKTHDNDGHGLAIQNSEDFIVDGLHTYGNGSVNNSGLAWPGCSRGTISNVVSYNNDEHGISTTAGFDVTICNVICFNNLQGGINFQSDSSENPSHTITLTNANCYGNDVGLFFKEVNENITVIGGHFNDNTTASIRLVDIGSSGLKSNQIRGIGVDVQTTTGSTLLNSNGSTRVNFPEVTNFRRGAFYPSATEHENFTPATEMDTRGTNHDFAETWFADNTGNIARATTSYLIDGRRINIIATNGSVTIQHNNGASETPFLNASGASVVLATGQGASWIYSADASGLVQIAN